MYCLTPAFSFTYRERVTSIAEATSKQSPGPYDYCVRTEINTTGLKINNIRTD
jgi:hypothetical protein